MKRRARVLGWARVKMAVGRDVEELLKYRGGLAEKARGGGGGGAASDGAKGATQTLNGNTATAAEKNEAAGIKRIGAGEAKKAGGDSASDKAADLIRVWNNINAQLKEAEMACTEIETPSILAQMVMGATADAASSNGGGNNEKAKGRKRSGSVTSAEEATAGSNDSNPGNNNNNENGKKSKSVIPSGLEPHVIPWDCMVEPQTPFDVPLLLSCLSSATDKACGFVSDKTNPSALTWLESTLPDRTSAYDNDAEVLAKRREEVRVLEEELARESDLNTKLQEQTMASRSRSDGMVAMMQLLRSETEAVLERHNLIMETPEARAKSTELHNELLEEEKLKNPSAEGDEEEEEEGEVDELNEELSSGEEENQDDEDEDERSDDDSVGIKEITVDKDSNDIHASEETDASEEDDDDGSEEEGEIAEGEEEGDHDDEDGEVHEEEEPRRSKRRPSHADEDDASNLTPPNDNPSAYRKRRRY
mmetsp:Transcript_21333/g.40202  ORF Transcript_21333/g.40202 Transcript_21333/m.40202 type:complete len:477 (+) Transcript_21333:2-1432(+)